MHGRSDVRMVQEKHEATAIEAKEQPERATFLRTQM
jgi:hypothetical protein